MSPKVNYRSLGDYNVSIHDYKHMILVNDANNRESYACVGLGTMGNMVNLCILL